MNKPKECPKCKSKKVLWIGYGLPAPGYKCPEDVFLGGCCVNDDFKWHCGNCNWEWGPNGAGGYNE